MIKPEQIPDEVVNAFYASLAHDQSDRKAIAAAINAWPQMHLHEWQRPWLGGMSGTDIILPLPQEVGDETIP